MIEAKLKILVLNILTVTSLLMISHKANGSCLKDGGTQTCYPNTLSDWETEYGVCSSVNLEIDNDPLCRYLQGGIRKSGFPVAECVDTTPITEKNILERALAYSSFYFDDKISMQDSGWGHKGGLSSLYVCYAKDPEYVNKALVRDLRTIDVSSAKPKFTQVPHLQLRATRTRGASCPVSTFKQWVGQNDFECPSQVNLFKNIQHCNGEQVGNPCSVTNGNKTLSETDWSNLNSPLKVTRSYSSLLSSIGNGWANNYELDLSFGEIQDTKFTLKHKNLSEPNISVVLKRANGGKIIAQRNFTDTTIAKDSGWFIDRDMNLQLINNGNIWQVKNVKTGVVETYQTLALLGIQPGSTTASTSVSTTTSAIPIENYKLNLTRIDYPNGQFINLTYQNGKLATVTDQMGNTLTYHYDITDKLIQIGLPSGKTIDYGYDNLGRLSTVKRPGYGIKTYIYDETNKAPNDNSNLLTGIIDENGKRYATYGYDIYNRGILTQHAGSTQSFSLNFTSDWTGNLLTNVTDEYGGQQRYYITTVSGTNRINEKFGNNQAIKRQYDQGGNITTETKNGVTTKYTFDQSRNLETSRIEGFGTAESRTTITEWATNLPVKTKITEGKADVNGNLIQALRITSFTYDGKGNALTKTITDPQTQESRTWSYTYNANSQKLTETNPQGQTTQWAYDNKGNLTQSVDAQGLVTSYSDYNADNKPQTITSPTGQVTTLTYDDAGRVLTQTVTIGYPSLTDISANQGIVSTIVNAVTAVFSDDKPVVKYDISKQGSQTATTGYQYDGVGQLIQTTLPDGQTISYQYDDAHRMIGMTDSLGNKISYTLNGAGDIIETKNNDPQGQLANSHKQSYDTLGRLTADTGNHGQNQRYNYDIQDNLIQTNDALSRSTSSQYDSLKRKIGDTDANGQPVKYTYNALDQLLTVTDSNGVTTSYSYNAFGDVLSTQSPDTGTASNQYNAKGQLVSQSDGANRTQNYAYDDKGRLIGRTDGTGKVLASYRYDDKGRISQLTDTSGQTTYQYNSNNQLIEKVQTTEQTTLTTRYHYTAGGQLDEIRYPSGQLVVYQYDKGILTGIQVKTTDNQTVQVIDSISYSPNGIKGYSWSQSKQAVSYQYDTDGRLTQINDPALSRSYQYDVGNRITNLTDSKANISQLFSHDKLDRLTSQTQGNSQFGYSYDNNSNRTQKTATTNGIAQASNTPVKAGTNQYQAYSYDASGKTLNDGVRSYTYNSEGRIERIQNGSVGVVNGYNALGQRVQKNSGNSKIYFSYDEQGKLLGEYDPQGNPIREYLYLGNAPISLISSEKAGQVLSIHSDHLGTPRAILGANSEVLWRWEGEAFGADSPSVASVKMPLRFAGQYADDETGLFYNYFRFYDPKTGRYVENDPIDLAGGLNRWGYVNGSPLNYTDPYGKSPAGLLGIGAVLIAATFTAIDVYPAYKDDNPEDMCNCKDAYEKARNYYQALRNKYPLVYTKNISFGFFKQEGKGGVTYVSRGDKIFIGKQYFCSGATDPMSDEDLKELIAHEALHAHDPWYMRMEIFDGDEFKTGTHHNDIANRAREYAKGI